MSSYTVEQTTVNQLSQTLQNKQNVGDYATNDNVDNKLKTNVINYTTNRILEIPHDIKLELNNGTLTLKAGSKLYYPDGFESDGTTPKFFEYIVPNDYSFTGGNYGFEGIHVLSFGRNQSGIDAHAEPDVMICYSGTTAPTGFGQYAYWWDLSINRFKWTRDSGSTWELYGTCLPVALFHYNGTNISSIDQVFNGLGYIGSTMFLLPGVKTVVPDGRNENGTCKNRAPSTVSSVKTETISRADTAYMFTNFVSSVIAIHHYICSKTKPTVTETTLWYNPETNLPSQVLSDGTVMTPYEEIPLAKFTSDSTGRITSFEPFTVDSVVNSNEFYQLKDKAVTTDTNQTISGSKRFTQPSGGMSIELVADTNQQTVPATATFRQLGLYRNSTYTKGDGYTSWLQAVRGSDGWNATELYTRRFLESDSQEIINYLRVNISPDGIPAAYTRIPPASCTGEEIVTAGWFRLPACSVKTVIETYHKGTDWYRIYSDGWCEQGGVVSSPATDSSKSVSLLKVFTDTNYSLLVTENGTTINTQESGSLTCLKRVSSFQLYNNGYGYSGHTVNWFACGY